MAATPMTATNKYYDVANTKCYLVFTTANPTAPTRSELDAGTDITGEIADVSGFTLSAEELEVPNMNDLFVGRIPGRQSAEDSSIATYGDINGNDITDLLETGDELYVVWLHGGDTANNKMDVYPVRVRSVSRLISLSDAARVQTEFSIRSKPTLGVAVPA